MAEAASSVVSKKDTLFDVEESSDQFEDTLFDVEESSDQFEDTLFDVEESSVQFEDYPGLVDMLSESDREKIFDFGIPLGIILTGPSGCGKTTLAKAIVGRLKVPFMRVTAFEFPSNEKENRMFIADLVKQAASTPCALIIEGFVCKPRAVSSTRDFQLRKHVATLFKDLNKIKTQIWIIATALSVTSVEVLIGKGNFQVVVEMGLPDDLIKRQILDVMVKQRAVNLEPELNFQQIVQDTPTYVAGDLTALVQKAVITAKLRTYDERKLAGELKSTEDESGFGRSMMAAKLKDVTLTTGDFQVAIKTITPAARCGAFFPVDRPNVKWDEDVCCSERLRQELERDFLVAVKTITPAARCGAFFPVDRPKVKWDEDVCCPESLRQELERDFLSRVMRPELYVSLEKSCRPTGILLHGPPGCGKTLIAKAMATEASMNFLFMNGSELLRMFQSDCEGEHVVQLLFEQARHASPCVVFVEEIDYLCQKHDRYTEGGILNQILPILDEINDRGVVYMIAATNHPDRLDPALVLPGRLDKPHYVGLPNADLRHKILLILTKKTALASDVNLERLAKDFRCKNLSGADLHLVISEAVKIRVRLLYKGETSEQAIFDDDIQKALSSLAKYRPC